MIEAQSRRQVNEDTPTDELIEWTLDRFIGQLQVANASPKGFDPVTTADILSGKCWSVPVIHQGRLLARNLDRVVCFDISG